MGKNQIGNLGLVRFRDHLAGKYEFTNLPIPANFWQYSFNAAYTQPTYALAELEKIGVDIWTPRADNERAGIVFFRTADHEGLHKKIKDARIYCGTFLGGIRFDPTFYNTTEDIDKLLDVVRSHVHSS